MIFANRCRCLKATVMGVVLALRLAAAPEWLELKTDEFTLYGNAGKSDMAEYAVNYTAFRRVLKEYFLQEGQRLPRSTVVLFNFEKEFLRYAEAHKREDLQTAMVTLSLDGSPVIALPAGGEPESSLSMAYEFETTVALEALGGYLPLWARQGTGKVLSSLEIRRSSIVLGGVERTYAEHLDELAWIPWPRFFKVTSTSLEYSVRADNPVYHAQAWALMSWILLKDGQGKERFRQLRERLKDEGGLTAVEAVMGTSPAQFRTEIHDKVIRLGNVARLPFDEATVRGAFSFRRADPARVDVLLAEILTQSGQTAEAAATLERARAREPRAVPVLEAFARRAMREGDPREAARLYREAIAAGSQNPMAYHRSALRRLEEIDPAGTVGIGEGGDAVYAAVDELRKVVELEPGNVEAYTKLARAYVLAPKVPPEAVEIVGAGIVPGPAGAAIRVQRATLYKRLNRTEEEFADLEAALDTPDIPLEVTVLASVMLSTDRFAHCLRKSRALLQAGKAQEAVRYVEECQAKKPVGGMREQYRTLLAQMQEAVELDTIQTLKAEKRWADVISATESFLANRPGHKRIHALNRIIEEAREELAKAERVPPTT